MQNIYILIFCQSFPARLLLGGNMFSKKLLLSVFIIAGKIIATGPQTPRSIAESEGSRYSEVAAGTLDPAQFKVPTGTIDPVIVDPTQIEELVREGTGDISLRTVPALLPQVQNAASPQPQKSQTSPKKSANLLNCCLKLTAQHESDGEATPKTVGSAFKEAAEEVTTAATKAVTNSPAVVEAAKTGAASITKAAVSSVK
jgi:hypothetical protein